MKNFLFILCIAGIAFWFGHKASQSDKTAELTERVAERVQERNTRNSGPSTASLVVDNDVSNETSNMIIQEQFESPEVSSDVSLASFLTSSDEALLFDTSHLDHFNAMEYHYAITNLDYLSDKTNLSYEVEQQLSTAINDYEGTSQEALRCSGSVCGVMFSGQTREEVNLALDGMIRNESLNSFSKGGVLRYVEENGVHYGVVVMVIGGEETPPLSLQ
ncbi:MULTISPECIES: hypothetical protein [Gammaproteobacteria]|uniref:hypothetical protein n=1 Tax=Gammaproteobacteria TaxID=1236 RepID=UPI000DD09049|nr:MULTISPECIES: hypothetical protein [Gammaproteobacteria]RTE86972.1 hypothetical protein DQX04_00865 [Aliidiomarina sp. B3213]TCZ93238.1 hypothetical protein EYQ95_04435 [Lysobacter sp. N42]